MYGNQFFREPSFRNTRHTLASTIVRLLGSRVVYEDSAACSPRSDVSKAETESTRDPSSMADLSSDVLFDRLLFVLHGLLSNHQPNWLLPRSSSNDSSKDFTLFDRDAAESLQVCQTKFIKTLPSLVFLTEN